MRLDDSGAPERRAPLNQAAVDEILTIGDRSQLTAAVARLHSSIANPFFGVGVRSDLMNSDINALYASQPDLIMGDRDYYLDPSRSIRTAYKVSGQNLRAFRADIDRAVAGVLSIETKLAEKNWSSVELRSIPLCTTPRRGRFRRPTMPSTGPSTIRQWASAISSRSSLTTPRPWPTPTN